MINHKRRQNLPTKKALVIDPKKAKGRKTSGDCYINFCIQKKHLTCGLFYIEPGKRLGQAKTHRCDEVYYIVKGTCWCELGKGEEYTIVAKEGMVVYIPAGTNHIAHNLYGKEETIGFYTILGKVE